MVFHALAALPLSRHSSGIAIFTHNELLNFLTVCVQITYPSCCLTFGHCFNVLAIHYFDALPRCLMHELIYHYWHEVI